MYGGNIGIEDNILVVGRGASVGENRPRIGKVQNCRRRFIGGNEENKILHKAKEENIEVRSLQNIER